MFEPQYICVCMCIYIYNIYVSNLLRKLKSGKLWLFAMGLHIFPSVNMGLHMREDIKEHEMYSLTSLRF